MNLKPKGFVSACWRNHDSLGHYGDKTLKEIWNNDNYKNIRKNLMNNIQHEGCKSCWDMEKANITSTRQQCNEDYAEYIPKVMEEVVDGTLPMNVKSIELRFGNVCDLRCRHCSSIYSSTWAVAVNKHDDVKRLFDKYQLTETSTWRGISKLPIETFNQVVNDIAPRVQEIVIAGGEPLIQPQHYDALERLLPYAHNITLEYNTNLNNITLQNRHVSDLWIHFKKVNCRVSIDGDKQIHSYLRTGSDLQVIENNIQTLKSELQPGQFNLTTTCTVSLYNISRFDDIINYYVSLDCPFHCSLVQYPEALNIQYIPNIMKDNITKRVYNTINNLGNLKKNRLAKITKWANYVIDYMNNTNINNEVLPKSTKEYIETMDRLNNTTFLDVYPEFKEYWQ
jgi:organic radical activating enzyme